MTYQSEVSDNRVSTNPGVAALVANILTCHLSCTNLPVPGLNGTGKDGSSLAVLNACQCRILTNQCELLSCMALKTCDMTCTAF